MRWTWSGCSRWRCSSIADGRVLVNEIAPRPHNSGHWTIDACPASQFELHIRAIAGLPLPPAARHSDAVMKNLVGPEEAALWPAILATPGLIPHLYGKAEARPGRKMGHVTRLFPRGSLPGRVRHRGGAWARCFAARGGGSASRRLSARSRGGAHAAFEDGKVGPALRGGDFLDHQNAAGGEDARLDHQIVEQAELLDQHAIGIAPGPVGAGGRATMCARQSPACAA